MKKLLLIISATILFTQCNQNEKVTETQTSVAPNDSSKNKADAINKVDTAKIDEFTQFKFSLLLANLPSPMEVLNDLNKSQIQYQPVCIIDKAKYKSAGTSAQKALFMGAYSIDLGYLVNYDKNQDMIAYLVSISKLSDELGISKYYNKDFSDRFSKNIGKKDSLMNMMNDASMLTDKYCNSNDNLKAAAYIFTGSWIESMNMATQAIKTVPLNSTNMSIYTRVWQQRFHLKQLIESVQKFKDDQYFKTTLPLLSQIQSICEKAKKETDLTTKEIQEIDKNISSLRKICFAE